MDGITPKPIQSQNSFGQNNGSDRTSSNSTSNDGGGFFRQQPGQVGGSNSKRILPPQKDDFFTNNNDSLEETETVEQNFVDEEVLETATQTLNDQIEPTESPRNFIEPIEFTEPVEPVEAIKSIEPIESVEEVSLPQTQNEPVRPVVSSFVPTPPPEPKVFLEPTPNRRLENLSSEEPSTNNAPNNASNTPVLKPTISLAREPNYAPRKSDVGVVLHATTVDGELENMPVKEVVTEDEFATNYNNSEPSSDIPEKDDDLSKEEARQDTPEPSSELTEEPNDTALLEAGNEPTSSEQSQPFENTQITENEKSSDDEILNPNNDIENLVSGSVRLEPNGNITKLEQADNDGSSPSEDLHVANAEEDAVTSSPDKNMPSENLQSSEDGASQKTEVETPVDVNFIPLLEVDKTEHSSLSPTQSPTAVSEISSEVPVNNQETEKVSYADSTIQELDLAKIVPNPYQPRKIFNQVALRELANSIGEHGVIQPLVVTETPTGYELVVGERRFRASQLAGLVKVPAIVKKRLEDQTKLEVALIENIQRQELNAIEEAQAYDRLIKVFNLTQDQVAQKVGKSRPTVANTLRLLNLPAEIQRGIVEGKISEGHGRAILGLPDIEKQILMYSTTLDQHLNVRQVEAKVRELVVKKRMDAAAPDPKLMALESKLRGTLGTQVKIQRQGRGGKIMIDFFSEEDLQEIIKKMAEQDEHGESPPYFVV